MYVDNSIDSMAKHMIPTCDDNCYYNFLFAFRISLVPGSEAQLLEVR